MGHKAKLNANGITLVEIIVSILIFAIGLTAILEVCGQSTAMARRTDAAYIAFNLAKNRIETLRSVDFGDLSSASETSTVVNESGVPDENGVWTRSTTVTPDFGGDANLTSVDVAVYYKVAGRQSANPMRMTTVVYSEG